MDIYLHPLFDGWLRSLSSEDTDDGVDWWEVQAEIAALLMALETHGRDLGDPECHEVVSSRYDMHALRRTPPTATPPYADAPPVLRLLFAFVADSKGGEAAVVLIGGDKTQLGNRWYPPHVHRAEERLEQWCRHHSDCRPIVKRGGPQATTGRQPNSRVQPSRRLHAGKKSQDRTPGTERRTDERRPSTEGQDKEAQHEATTRRARHERRNTRRHGRSTYKTTASR